ncbi:MAG: ABC-2 family transporter protein [bacterium]
MKVTAFNRYYRIFLLRFKASLMSRMAYPLNFFLLLISVVIQSVITIIFVRVVFSFADSISGWTYDQAMIVVASFLLIEGFSWVTTAQFAGIRRNVKIGSFDLILIKPVNTLFLVSVWRSDPEDIMRVVVALGIFISVMGSMHFTAADWLFRLFFYGLTIINGYLILLSLNLMINSLFFWFTEATGINNMFENITRMGQYPTGILYGKIAKFILSFIIPIAFLGTIPANIFIKSNYLTYFIYSLLIMAALLYISLRVFKAGIKAYSSASS